MLWHKHMSDMIDDPKMRRLVKRFGADGYAVYNLILERVTKRLSTESPAPDLEESATDLADLLSMDTVRVEEIVWFCIQEGLFDQDEVSGRVLVLKVYKFIQQSETRSKRIRELISAYKASETVTDKCGMSQTNVRELEQNRTEQNRINTEREREVEPKKRDGKVKHPRLSCPMTQGWYDRIVSEWGEATADRYIERVMAWDSAGGHGTKDFAARAHTFISRDVDAGKLTKRQQAAAPKTHKELAREAFGEEYKGE